MARKLRLHSTRRPMGPGSEIAPGRAASRGGGSLPPADPGEAAVWLAGGIGHDLNNLLTVILGAGEFLEARLEGEERGRAEEILRAAEQATALSRQLVTVAGGPALAPSVVDLNAVIRETEPLLRRFLGRGVELAVRLGAGHALVAAQPGQLCQVLLNLAANARDAMPRGGRFTLETEKTAIRHAQQRGGVTVPPGRYVTLRALDTGVGIDAETQARVFEPFFTTKEPGTGRGLGLSTVARIVEQNGGYVWIWSAPGQGALFTIHLPAAPQASS